MSDMEDNGSIYIESPAMTLREYAAIKAMQGMMSRDTFDPGQETPEQRARLAVIEAEALLAELNKEKS